MRWYWLLKEPTTIGSNRSFVPLFITIKKDFSYENLNCNFIGTDTFVSVQCSILVPLEKGRVKNSALLLYYRMQRF
ncbi:MAG TPA: hypothetical protein DCR21_06375 [Succinivibrionaceae bacterium]|nr:hypothetical protein [Succinivibrionaceae bacterium]